MGKSAMKLSSHPSREDQAPSQAEVDDTLIKTLAGLTLIIDGAAIQFKKSLRKQAVPHKFTGSPAGFEKVFVWAATALINSRKKKQIVECKVPKRNTKSGKRLDVPEGSCQVGRYVLRRRVSKSPSNYNKQPKSTKTKCKASANIKCQNVGKYTLRCRLSDDKTQCNCNTQPKLSKASSMKPKTTKSTSIKQINKTFIKRFIQELPKPENVTTDKSVCPNCPNIENNSRQSSDDPGIFKPTVRSHYDDGVMQFLRIARCRVEATQIVYKPITAPPKGSEKKSITRKLMESLAAEEAEMEDKENIPAGRYRGPKRPQNSPVFPMEQKAKHGRLTS